MQLSDFHQKLSSLCLRKVLSEETNYEDLPPGLFNGNFSSISTPDNDIEDHGIVHVHDLYALTILYDGVSWSFSDRSVTVWIPRCF